MEENKTAPGTETYPSEKQTSYGRNPHSEGIAHNLGSVRLKDTCFFLTGTFLYPVRLNRFPFATQKWKHA